MKIMSDIINSDTKKPHTWFEWRQWMEVLRSEKVGTMDSEGKVIVRLTDAELDSRATALVNVMYQVPREVIQAVATKPNYGIKANDLVALVHHEDGDEEAEVAYGIFTPSATAGDRIQMVQEDTVGRWHLANRYRAAAGAYEVHAVETWQGRGREGERIIGPKGTVFPCPKGWKIDGKKVEIDKLEVKNLTQVLTSRRFLAPTQTEAAWQARLAVQVCFEKMWKIKCFFATPRDQITWLKLQHRNLFTASRDATTDGRCQSCAMAQENQLHLAECTDQCRVILREFWSPILELVERTGGELPIGTGRQPGPELTAYLVTGRISDEKVVGACAAGVLFLAWRCLYAAIEHSGSAPGQKASGIRACGATHTSAKWRNRD